MLATPAIRRGLPPTTMFHTVMLVIFGWYALSVAHLLRKIRAYRLTTVYMLACAGVVLGSLLHWPMTVRILFEIVAVGGAIIGGLRLRCHGIR